MRHGFEHSIAVAAELEKSIGVESFFRNRPETTIHGWTAVVLSMPFDLVGFLLLLASIRQKAGDLDVPIWAFPTSALLFLFAGLS